MFNNKMTDVLTQINGITNSVILQYPQTIALSESMDMMALVDFSSLDSDEFPDLGMKDSLGEFLSLIKLFPKDRDISIDNNVISVAHGRNSSSFITDNIVLMDAYKKDPAQFTRTEQAPSVASFEINVEDIKNIKSASGVFKYLTEVIFESKDGEMNISLGATNKFNAKTNTYSVIKEADTNKEFNITIPVNNFKMLPVSNYQVDVKYNSDKDDYRILLTNSSLEGFKILMSVKNWI